MDDRELPWTGGQHCCAYGTLTGWTSRAGPWPAFFRSAGARRRRPGGPGRLLRSDIRSASLRLFGSGARRRRIGSSPSGRGPRLRRSAPGDRRFRTPPPLGSSSAPCSAPSAPRVRCSAAVGPSPARGVRRRRRGSFPGARPALHLSAPRDRVPGSGSSSSIGLPTRRSARAWASGPAAPLVVGLAALHSPWDREADQPPPPGGDSDVTTLWGTEGMRRPLASSRARGTRL